MSEYLNKQAVLEWLKQEQRDEGWLDQTKHGFFWVEREIESGAFDADNTEVQRLRAALEWIVECGTDYQSINKARNALHFIKGGEKDE